MLLTRRTFKSLFLFLFLAPRSMPSVSQSVSQSQHSQSLPDQKEIIEGSSTYIIPLLNGPQILSPSRSSTTKHRESPARRKQTPTPNSFTSCTNFFGGNLRIINVKKIGQRVSKRISPPARKIPSSATECRSQISQTPSDRARAFFLLLRDSFALRTTVWLPPTGGF